MTQLKKSDLIKILVDEYGYEKEDLKFDVEGKPYTNAKLKQLIDLEKKDEEEAIADSTRIQATPSRLKATDKIYIMNGDTGAVVYNSVRSNKRWLLDGFGKQDTMEYEELMSMHNRYPKYIDNGLFIVLNKEVQDELKLTEKYKNILTPENIDDVFELDIEQLDRLVDSLPEAQKSTFITIAQEKRKNKTLDSFRVLDYIEEKFKFRFDDNAPTDDLVLSSEKIGTAQIIQVDRK